MYTTQLGFLFFNPSRCGTQVRGQRSGPTPALMAHTPNLWYVIFYITFIIQYRGQISNGDSQLSRGTFPLGRFQGSRFEETSLENAFTDFQPMLKQDRLDKKTRKILLVHLYRGRENIRGNRLNERSPLTTE